MDAGLKQDGIANFDFAAFKNFGFGERVNLQGIMDLFNIVNRYNVAAVNPLFTVAGQPTAAYDPRQFQFALKVIW